MQQNTAITTRQPHTLSVSVVVPAYNAGKYIRSALASIMMNKLVRQVIVVNDCSTDDTVAQVERLARIDKRITLLHLATNSGAGVARNEGAKHITEPYCAFIDADDFLTEKALDDAASLLHEHGGDFLVYKWLPANMHGALTGNAMDVREEEMWAEALQGAPLLKTNARTTPGILRTLNFPWNKIYRTAFFHAAHICYSSTFIHNDNLAHWMSFIQAESFVLYDKYLIIHKRDFRRTQLSTIMDLRRFQLFQAFDDVDAFFAAHTEYADLYPHFCCYKRDLYRGTSVHLPPELLPEYSIKTAKSLQNVDSTLFFRICSIDPHAAKDVYDMRFDPLAYYSRLQHIFAHNAG